MNQKVRCNYCKKTFGTQLQLSKHAKKAHLEKISKEWLPCNDCELLFPTEDALSTHNVQTHTQRTDKSNNSERVKCRFCTETLCSIQQFYKHANKDHLDFLRENWHCCEICSFYLPTSMALTNHKGKAHILKNGSKRFQCEFCSDTICSLQQYYKHANKEHLKEVAKTWAMCATCQFYLPTVEAVNKHSGKAHQAKHPNQCTERITCSYCPDSLCSLQQYYKHANKDHFDIVVSTWHMCPVCNFYLPTIVAMTNHKGKAHAPPKKGPSTRFACTFCSEVLKNSDEYHTHANSNHPDEIADKWQIHCKFCKLYFPTSLALKKHKEQCHIEVTVIDQSDDSKVMYFTDTTIQVIEVTTSEDQ